MKLTEDELRELARQLRCPDKNEGLQVAEMMNVVNAYMISKAIASLNLEAGDAVLELGPGNGKHIETILETGNIKYFGADISEVMVAECNMRYSEINNVHVRLTDGISLQYPDGYFDRIFTVNTIYFWEEPNSYASEIFRVLKSEGVLCIAYIPERVMRNIPFAKYGFAHYSEIQVKNLLSQAGFLIRDERIETELVTNNAGQQIQREFVIINVTKYGT